MIRLEHTARTHSAAFSGDFAILKRQLKRRVARGRRRQRYPTSRTLDERALRDLRPARVESQPRAILPVTWRGSERARAASKRALGRASVETSTMRESHPHQG